MTSKKPSAEDLLGEFVTALSPGTNTIKQGEPVGFVSAEADIAKLWEAVGASPSEPHKLAILPNHIPTNYDQIVIKSEQAVAHQTVKHPDGTTTSTQEVVDKPKLFAGPVCNVGVTAKLTIPTAPYANAQVGVSLNVPCAHGEIDQVYEFAKEWVDARMAKLHQDITKANT